MTVSPLGALKVGKVPKAVVFVGELEGGQAGVAGGGVL